MFLSMLKKNSYWSLIIYSALMTSCVTPTLNEKKIEMTCIEMPCQWHTPLDKEMSEDDPEFFLWWEAFHDPLLTYFIEEAACRNSDVKLSIAESHEKGLETMTLIASSIAKNYLELRGHQLRLSILEKRMQTQNLNIIESADLTKSGFTSGIEEGKTTQNLYTLLAEKSQITLSINKLIFHLSSLLNYLPSDLSETLSVYRELPSYPEYIPVGSPIEILSRNQALKDAKRDYQITKSSPARLTYEKKFYSLIEEVESAIATLRYENEAYKSLQNIYLISQENYQLTLDLYNQGLKDDPEVQANYLEFLNNEDVMVQAKIKLLQDYVSLYQTIGGNFTICSQ